MELRQITSKRIIRRGPKQTRIESLEGRCLLADGALSVVVGESLFYVSTDGRELWKSNLDGSQATKIQTWTNGKGPTWLTAVNDTLYFAAGFTPTSSTSGRELWKSNGFAEGTVAVRDIYPGNQPSNPRDLVVVNDYLMFIANAASWTSVFTTDGTRDGTIGLIGRSNFYLPNNLQVVDDQLYVDYYNGTLRRQEWWRSDGTLAGTVLQTGARIQPSGVVQVFGGDASNTILVTGGGDDIHVFLDGNQQSFSRIAVTGIEIWAHDGNDDALVDPGITLDATIFGDGGNDTLEGGSGNDLIDDKFGNNWLNGGTGNDSLQISWHATTAINTLIGGEGDDVMDLTHDGGSAVIWGGGGHDSITTTWRNDWIDGGEGNDSINGGDGYDTVSGGGGDDSISAGHDDDAVVFGNDGNDFIQTWLGDDTVDGGAGADTISVGLGVDSVVADAADMVTDELAVTLMNAWLYVSGTNGDDQIELRFKAGGTSIIQVVVNGQLTEIDRDGSDRPYALVSAGHGNDLIVVDPNFTLRTQIKAGAGDDTVFGGGGFDEILGSTGDDHLYGGGEGDQINPGLGSDVIDGGAGDDQLSYRDRTERLLKTHDLLRMIHTDAGEVDAFVNIEELVTGTGNDVILANRAVDGMNRFDLGAGNDSIIARRTQGTSPSTIYGGEGDDTIVAVTGDSIIAGGGSDVITLNLPPPPPVVRPVRPPIRTISLS